MIAADEIKGRSAGLAGEKGLRERLAERLHSGGFRAGRQCAVIGGVGIIRAGQRGQRMGMARWSMRARAGPSLLEKLLVGQAGRSAGTNMKASSQRRRGQQAPLAQQLRQQQAEEQWNDQANRRER